MDNELLYQISDISYAYDKKLTALEHVSITVRKGEKLAILGANGSGKSTLLKLMDGLYFPDTGQVIFEDQVLSEEAFQNDDFHYAFRRRVGLVFQDSDVQLFCPSVWEEVAFAPLQIGLSRAEVEGRVQAALAALRIEKLAERAPHHLSGGEKKRVALASVLSLEPQVWLLDEPSAGLDPRSQAWLEGFIEEQGEAGKTMVTATHDLSIVEAIADRVYVFDEGHHLAAEGTPGEILSDTALLTACNLLHEHRHHHISLAVEHSHPHQHPISHEHM